MLKNLRYFGGSSQLPIPFFNGFFTKISKSMKGERRTPLKTRVSTARSRLRIQSDHLEQALSRLQNRNKQLFEKCVASKSSRNNSRALIYANECAEIRKIARIIMNGQLALEQVVLRLETVEELGDIFVQMGPLINIVQEIQGQLTGVLPDVSNELGEINSALNAAVLEAGSAADHPSVSIAISDEEAQRVLAEAKVIADERMEERFPTLPDGLEEVEEPVENVEEQVYEYILAQGDRRLSISTCASALNLSPERIKEAISTLTENHRILVEEKT